MTKPLISIVLPVYNEEETILVTIERLQAFIATQQESYELIFVDDGSKDRSVPYIAAAIEEFANIRLIEFSRNFGHQIAISAGVRYAKGQAVVVMDADLQDPPEVVAEMVRKWQEGYEVVYGKRKTREGETWFKKFSAQAFYRLLKSITEIDIPLDTGDFRLMDARVVEQLSKMHEHRPFVRGMVSWVGYRQTAVEYERQERYSGETKYPLKKMLGLAFDGITSFSQLPLRLANYGGSILLGFGLLYLLIGALFHGLTGSAMTIVAISFVGGLILLALGMIGVYLERLIDDTKGRPLYIVSQTHGFPREMAERFQLETNSEIPQVKRASQK